jgi:hypothetical protein
MVEDFNFREAWSHLNEYEGGRHDFEDDEREKIHPNIENTDNLNKNISNFLEMKEISDRDEILKNLFNNFLKSLLRYIYTIDTLSLARRSADDEDNSLKNAADKNRRIAHDSWMSDTNALSRYYAKLGIDNSWRNVIGFSRIEQTNWALSVSKFARKMAMKGED